jgi:hypothetical protein
MDTGCDMSTGQLVGRFCACRLAVAIGFVWALGVLLLGVVTMFTDSYGHEMVKVIGSVYWGYEPGSFIGALAGGVFGFVDAFIGTLLVLLVYKALMGGCCCCAKKDQPDQTSQQSDTPEQ